MDPSPENLQHLTNFLGQTLAPDAATRKQAEVQLGNAKVQQGYPLLLLRLVSSAAVPEQIRLQGAIQFKNLVVSHWVVSEVHDFHVNEADKPAVKAEIVEAMLAVPDKLQPFLSEALSCISKADFPLDMKWPELVPKLMQSLSSPDPAVIIATLKTTHAIVSKYVSAAHTDELWAEIAMVLSQTHAKLLETQQSCLAMLQQQAANKPALDQLFQTLDLIAKIFHDLNYQDIPEVFEDNLDTWMAGFHTLLTLPAPVTALFQPQVRHLPLQVALHHPPGSVNPRFAQKQHHAPPNCPARPETLTRAAHPPQDDEEKLSAMHSMQRSICEALHLYAEKVCFRACPSLPLALSLTRARTHSHTHILTHLLCCTYLSLPFSFSLRPPHPQGPHPASGLSAGTPSAVDGLIGKEFQLKTFWR